MRSITITGVEGFVGTHVARLAHDRGISVIGISRSREIPDELAQLLTDYIPMDLSLGFPDVPVGDAIIHLAGLAAVGPSFNNPQQYIEVNSSMVTHMCEAMLSRSHNQRARVIAVSSGAVYAAPTSDAKLSEQSALFMSSPYVVSKVLLENLFSYYAARGLQTIVARPFNHIGPGQGPGFLVPDLWQKLQNLGHTETIRVGNLVTERDYLDVRDVAEAYLALAESEISSGETFNICSGASTSGESILAQLCALDDTPIPELEIDEALMRPQDAPRIVGNPEKLMLATGWSPKYTLEQSLRDFISANLEASG